jgi:methanogenic corrinoid protein MtbC1
MKPIISPRELAAAIGVSESSLKRWSDEGHIRVAKTAGGHRRIAIGEAIRFVRTIGAPILKPELLGLNDVQPGGDALISAAPAERLFELLREGHAREARGFVLSLYLSGQSVAEIADGPIRSAMDALGRLWQHDAGGIFIEHRATDICIQAVQQLRQLVERPDAGMITIGCAPSGDPYLLPTMISCAALAAEGHRAVNLGPDTPFAALTAAVEQYVPHLVWLSISAVRDARELLDGLHALSVRLSERDVTLAIGGRAARELDLPRAPCVRTGETIADLVRIAADRAGPRPAGATN